MSKNNLYTQSYFVKRLVEAGFDVKRLNIEFETKDTRKWTILVNFKDVPQKCNIIITCIKNSTDDFFFKLMTIDSIEFCIRTMSMEIVIEQLKKIYFDMLTKQIL